MWKFSRPLTGQFVMLIRVFLFFVPVKISLRCTTPVFEGLYEDLDLHKAASDCETNTFIIFFI